MISPHIRHENLVPSQVWNVKSGFVFKALQLEVCK